MMLTEFLLARIAEDEAVIGPDDERTWEPYYRDSRNRLEFTHDGLMIAPSRMRAECEAKRRILSEHEPEHWPSGSPSCVTCGDSTTVDWPCATLRLLVLPYTDHPDCDQAWRP